MGTRIKRMERIVADFLLFMLTDLHLDFTDWIAEAIPLCSSDTEDHEYKKHDVKYSNLVKYDPEHEDPIKDPAHAWPPT
jgi:hypothetical protein